MSNHADHSLDALLARLYHRHLHTIKLGLDAVTAVLSELDNPQDAFLSIHVAGTNGKGSTSAMIASVLQAAGFRVGLYTSPHLRRFNERVQVNGQMIPDDRLLEAMERVEDAAKRAQQRGFRDVTFFEFTTALAFAWFRQSGVHVAVVETGMGGKLDATNVVMPIVSVITSIGLDHQSHLGDSIEKIATEKAGIIKPNRPVVCGELSKEAADIMRKSARENSARIAFAADVCTVTRTSQTFDGQRLTIESGDETIGRVVCPLLGRHQLGNVAVAVTALQEFAAETNLAISSAAVRDGLSAVRWPARIQLISSDPVVLLDGAHNIEATAVLCRTLDELREKRPVGLIVSYSADKDAIGCLRLLAPRIDRCWTVHRETERAMDDSALAAAVGQAGLDATSAPLGEAMKQGYVWAREKKALLLITGSLYLAGEVLDWMTPAGE